MDNQNHIFNVDRLYNKKVEIKKLNLDRAKQVLKNPRNQLSSTNRDINSESKRHNKNDNELSRTIKNTNRGSIVSNIEREQISINNNDNIENTNRQMDVFDRLQSYRHKD